MEVEDEEPGHQKRRRKLAVLPWMRHPVSIPTGTDVDIVKLRGINPGLAASLDSNGIDRLFAVQAATWRHGWRRKFQQGYLFMCPHRERKTLAHALPVLQGLWDRTNVSRLRALIVVPMAISRLSCTRVLPLRWLQSACKGCTSSRFKGYLCCTHDKLW